MSTLSKFMSSVVLATVMCAVPSVARAEDPPDYESISVDVTLAGKTLAGNLGCGFPRLRPDVTQLYMWLTPSDKIVTSALIDDAAVADCQWQYVVVGSFKLWHCTGVDTNEAFYCRVNVKLVQGEQGGGGGNPLRYVSVTSVDYDGDSDNNDADGRRSPEEGNSDSEDELEYPASDTLGTDSVGIFMGVNDDNDDSWLSRDSSLVLSVNRLLDDDDLHEVYLEIRAGKAGAFEFSNLADLYIFDIYRRWALDEDFVKRIEFEAHPFYVNTYYTDMPWNQPTGVSIDSSVTFTPDAPRHTQKSLDSLCITPVCVDIDVDSDNQEFLDEEIDEYNFKYLYEDFYEAHPADFLDDSSATARYTYGMLVPTNDGDSDDDGNPDNGWDGTDYDGPNADSIEDEDQLRPMILRGMNISAKLTAFYDTYQSLGLCPKVTLTKTGGDGSVRLFTSETYEDLPLTRFFDAVVNFDPETEEGDVCDSSDSEAVIDLLEVTEGDTDFDVLVEGLGIGEVILELAFMITNGADEDIVVHKDKVRITVAVLGFDLDTDGDGDLEYPTEGIDSYLPGYLADTAKIDGAASPQEMNLIAYAPGGAYKATFTLSNVSTEPGYCMNSPIEAGMGDDDDDISFAETAEQLTVTVNVVNGKAVAPIYCKDYGASCDVTLQFKAADDSLVGDAITKGIPVNTDPSDDKIADLYEKEQLVGWQAQYGLATFDTEDLTFFGNTDDKEEKDADGTNNGDGGRNLPDHKVAGDGLSAYDEYRGYLFAGGANGFGGGHKRLTAFRKELLIQVSESPNIANAAKSNANAAAQTYSFTQRMTALADYYNNPADGAGIDIYWVRDDLVLGPQLVDPGTGAQIRPNAYYFLGTVAWPPISVQQHPNAPTGTMQGSVSLRSDGPYKNLVTLAQYQAIFGSSSSGFPLQSNRAARHDPFVHCLLLERDGIRLNNGTYRAQAGGAAVAGYFSANQEENGVYLYINTISEEGVGITPPDRYYTNTEFNNILDYSFAHEFGHLLIQTVNDPQWGDGAHIDIAGALMSSTAVGLQGISACRFHDDEIKMIDLPNRASAK